MRVSETKIECFQLTSQQKIKLRNVGYVVSESLSQTYCLNLLQFLLLVSVSRTEAEDASV